MQPATVELEFEREAYVENVEEMFSEESLARFDQRRDVSLGVGDAAPDFPVHSLEGGDESPRSVMQGRRGRPLVLCFGSYS